MFGRESDAVSPRLGRKILVALARTWCVLYASTGESVDGKGRAIGRKSYREFGTQWWWVCARRDRAAWRSDLRDSWRGIRQEEVEVEEDEEEGGEGGRGGSGVVGQFRKEGERVLRGGASIRGRRKGRYQLCRRYSMKADSDVK
ncbi:uncharacterized protein LOC122525012 [Polistes fuscatus]|uniref:uncharacterized protein LOC122525012 n=1 Tax=Polistes fuscatus TaxID=30207 RepID=UPI001CA8B551|nr:uncharacterized protein LOC122525012 [Polistes fuscatus]